MLRSARGRGGIFVVSRIYRFCGDKNGNQFVDNSESEFSEESGDDVSLESDQDSVIGKGYDNDCMELEDEQTLQKDRYSWFNGGINSTAVNDKDVCSNILRENLCILHNEGELSFVGERLVDCFGQFSVEIIDNSDKDQSGSVGPIGSRSLVDRMSMEPPGEELEKMGPPKSDELVDRGCDINKLDAGRFGNLAQPNIGPIGKALLARSKDALSHGKRSVSAN